MLNNITNKRILLYGCGGGFDIYAGFFLYRHLSHYSKHNTVHLANVSFTDDLYTYGDTPIVEITSSSPRTKKNTNYFPELDLACFLSVPIYAVRLFGPNKCIPALSELCSKLSIDLIIAIDAGHDALLFGDEGDTRGSPLEDMISIVTISTLTCCIEKLLCCISVPTEDIPMSLFYKHVQIMKEAGGFIEKVYYKNPEDILHYRRLLDSTPAETRSIPNECILAALENRIGVNYRNLRLQVRMETDGCNELDYPNVTEDTKYYWCFDIPTLVKTSPLIKRLVDQGKNCDMNEFNALIGEFYMKNE